MFLNTIASLASGVSESVGGAINGWSERKTIKAASKAKIEELRMASELKVAELEAEAMQASAIINVEKAKTGQEVDATHDFEAIRQMKNSYKDEFLLILFSTPLILSFIPQMQDYVVKGWEMLKIVPDWYMWLYIGMVVSIYGMRGMARSIIESKLFSGKKK